MTPPQPQDKPKIVITSGLIVAQGIFMTILALALLGGLDLFWSSGHVNRLLASLTPEPWAFLYGFALAVPFFLFGELIWVLRYKLGLRGESTEDLIEKTTPGGYAIFSLFSGAPEEVFFRGALQPILGTWLSSALFGLSHCTGKRSLPYMVETFILGLALSWLYVWSGNLWVCIVIHVVNNFLSFTLAKHFRALFGVGSAS